MAVKTLLLLLLITITVSAAKKSYAGYKVYSVVPKSQNDVNTLVDIEKRGVGEFWKEQLVINRNAQIMVSKENQPVFLEEMESAHINVIETIADLQKLIGDQAKPATSSRQANTESLLSMTWDKYYNLTEIYNWLDELIAEYPNIVKPTLMGESNEHREIRGIIINFRPDRSDKLIGMMESTLHAREWICPATVTWIVKEFLTSTDPEVRALAEHFEWHIFPVVNPDGYEYSFTHDRMWRKNRNTDYGTNCSATVDNDMSNGVDLNRNFGHMWMTIGASSDPCSNTFAGSAAFSESESRSIAQYVLGLREQGRFIYYYAFHSYTQLIVIPYSHIVNNADVFLANNYANMFEIAIKGAEKAEERFGTPYRAGVSAAIMYPMSGTSFDWVKYAADVPVTYLFELRDLGEYGFLLPADQIIPNNLEVMDMLIEMDRATRALRYYSGSGTSVFSSLKMICFSVIFALFVHIKA